MNPKLIDGMVYRTIDRCKPVRVLTEENGLKLQARIDELEAKIKVLEEENAAIIAKGLE